MEKNIEKTIYKTIYEWVAKNFGESEAEDPSWSIKALAHDLAKSQLPQTIYRQIEHMYLTEDCKEIAEENDIELTDEQIEWVVEEFKNTDAYVDRHTDDWLYFMHQAKGNE